MVEQASNTLRILSCCSNCYIIESQAGGPRVDSRFEGKTAILTGGSRGIGLRHRRAPGRRRRAGRHHRRVTRRRSTQRSLGWAARTRAQAVAGKADDPEHQAATVRRAIEAFGSARPAGEQRRDQHRHGPAHGDRSRRRPQDRRGQRARAAAVDDSRLRRLDAGARRRDRQHLLDRGRPGGARTSGFYGASKAMLAHLTASLAVELGPTVRVNAVGPAVIKTQFAAPLYEGREEEMAATYPLKRLGVPVRRGRRRRVPAVRGRRLDHRAAPPHRRRRQPRQPHCRPTGDPAIAPTNEEEHP